MDNTNNKTRRDFIKKSAIGVSGLTIGGALPGFGAQSYKQILGANERINVSVMGVNSRGFALSEHFASQKECKVIHLCDVDSRAFAKVSKKVQETAGNIPELFSDFRKSLESKAVDALVVAAPDHWHAPAALMALKADKHVYLEKPCSHNPREGEILIDAVEKYGKVIQMGNQRRSWSNIMLAMNELRSGIIGEVYYAKGWYTNKRKPIGFGKKVAIPDWLDWELWQGPAPRKDFKDNYLHYNWHWFWHWGTGEALNNGTHTVDLMRWGLGVDYPVRVSSNGGRYHYSDDWETPDTQVISMDFAEGKTLTWEGRSCNPRKINGSSVGVMFYGEKGSLFITGGNEYTLYDFKGDVIKKVESEEKINVLDLTNPLVSNKKPHIQNFFNAIKHGETLKSDILSGHKSTLLVQLGNIAQRVGQSLEIDPKNGHILNNKKAKEYWTREYEKGWEMKL